MDPYQILQLPKKFTLEQLKENYKRIALHVHPDKGGTEELFQLVTKAYKVLVEEHNRRVAERDFNELKSEFQKTLRRTETAPRPRAVDPGSSRGGGGGGSFNLDRFNQIFSENKVETAADKGYEGWMKDAAPPEQPKLRGGFNEKQFHRQFEKQQAVDKNNKYIIQYREPEPMLMAKKIGFTELGQEEVDDFSGANTSHKNLNYMDYKVAHTTNRLVDPTLVKNAKSAFKNVDELEKARSQVRYEMNETEMEEYELQQQLEKLREQKRQAALRRHDEETAQLYERVNRLTIGMRR